MFSGHGQGVCTPIPLHGCLYHNCAYSSSDSYYAVPIVSIYTIHSFDSYVCRKIIVSDKDINYEQDAAKMSDVSQKFQNLCTLLLSSLRHNVLHK